MMINDLYRSVRGEEADKKGHQEEADGPDWRAQARQGEVGLVVGDEYFAIRDFAEE